MIISRHPLIQRLDMRQGEAQLIRSQICHEFTDDIVQVEQVESLAWRLWDTTSNTDAPTLVDSGTLDVASCWYDTWQPWGDNDDDDNNGLGFNFAYRFPAALFATAATGDRQFKLEVKGVQAVTGETFMAVDAILNAAGSLWGLS